MDPALEHAVRRGPAHLEIEVAALLARGAAPPNELRVVATFGDVVSARVRLGHISEVRKHPAVVSLKASRIVRPADATVGTSKSGRRSRTGGDATGAGCLLVFLDWGCDFAHPSFLRPGGGSRLRALWDQRGPGDGNRWGYGRVLTRESIDRALSAGDRYAALGYGLGPRPAHGTHVMDIAAGNGGLAGSEAGVAPEADLAFVHLASNVHPGDGDLGDSVRVLEALDFARWIAGDDPFVVNMSLGRTAGDHTGRSIVERAMDALLEEAPGRAIVQSAGNYFGKCLHASGTLRPAETASLEWVIDPDDTTTNELEVWYPGRDRLSVEIIPSGGAGRVTVGLGESAMVTAGGRNVGAAYHRQSDPLNGDHHLDIFLEPGAPPGTWQVRLHGSDVVDGRWHAWIERDSVGPHSQSRFRPDVATNETTLGSIASGLRTLVVGAIDPSTNTPAPFSSRGPSRDGRPKPDLVAPGVGIIAARSTPPGAVPGSAGLVEMSGTSMASPHVAGLVALLFGRAPRKLSIAETRVLVLGSTCRIEGDPMRTGAGVFDTEAALASLRCMFSERRRAMPTAGGVVTAPRSSWAPVGSEDFEREVEGIFGPLGAYDLLGYPGRPLRGPVRPGDVLVRVQTGAVGGPSIARVVADGLYGPEGLPDEAEAESEGDGLYAEAIVRRPGARVGAPSYRLVAGRNGIVPAGQVVLRPIGGPGRSPFPIAPPIAQPIPPPAVPDEPPSAEPSPGDEPPEDREDQPRTRRSTTRLDFSDEPVQISVPVIEMDSSSAELEIDASINNLGRLMLPFATSYLGGLEQFETNMLFASDQETQPRYFDVTLNEVAKLLVEHGIKHALEEFPVLGEVVGAVKAVVTAWYEEKERAEKASGERRIAVYITEARRRINELVQRLTASVNLQRRPLLEGFRAAVARSAPGQGRNRRLTGDAAQFLIQLRRAITQFGNAIPTTSTVQQVLTERFIGPSRLTTYISQGGRQSATLYLEVKLYHDKSASKPWQVKGVDSSWVVPSLSPHPDRLATSLKSALIEQHKEVWRTNLPKMVHLNIEEEVTGLNEYRDGWIRFSSDPATYEVRSNYGLPQFDQAWRVPEVRAAALGSNGLVGKST
ncbi:MAG TPA: S8 family serine peptidase [Myxococcaceae bacterium]|nr:S8 family serine peptidase [Myxococcaceae bacterium]